MNRIRLMHGAAALALAVSVAGCGGGGGDTAQAAPAPAPAPQDGVPASASTSVQALDAWMKPLVAMAPAVVDVLEPLDVTSFSPPTSDTDEPDPSV
jgi:hypothetical protein